MHVWKEILIVVKGIVIKYHNTELLLQSADEHYQIIKPNHVNTSRKGKSEKESDI